MSKSYPPPPESSSPVTEPQRLPTSSQSPVDERLASLRQLIPEAFADGKVDFDRLRVALGDSIEVGRERFGLNWPGKVAAMRAVQSQSSGTLVPDRGQSVDFDNTEHVFIEGDNLEVLKLLQKSYNGKVKLIYIDPPYNTGGEFVYPDNFHEGLDDYLEFSKQVTAGGYRVSANTDTDGRYHSKWLSMMWPRLFLARSLLDRDLGVIAVSIDDHEVSGLISVLDEIFGQENQLAVLIWDKQHSQQQGMFKRYHEYILVYARNASTLPYIGGGSGKIVAGALKKVSRSNPASSFTFPAGTRFEATDGTVLRGTFGDAEQVTVLQGELRAQGGKTVEPVTLSAGWTQKNQMTSWFAGRPTTDSRNQKVLEFFFNSKGKLKCVKEREMVTPPTLLPKYGMVSQATAHVAGLLGGSFFENPKPADLLKDLAQWFTDDSDLVLDFFAGSGTFAEAVIDLNANDGANRKCILVQLPQPTPAGNPYPTISALGRERWRRVIAKQQSSTIQASDLGFRALRLDSSCFRKWNADTAPRDPQALALQIGLFADQVEVARDNEAVLFELMLRRGLELSAKIERVEIEGITWYTFQDGGIWICPAQNIPRAVFDAVLARDGNYRPSEIVILDRAFGDDETKANVVQQFLDTEISADPKLKSPSRIDIQVL